MKFLFLVFLFFGCGDHYKTISETAVVNGVETESYRAIVDLKLLRENGAIGLCTGTFIKKDLVLTAAHCVDGVLGVEVFGVRANKIIVDKNHEYTFNGMGHDFALLKFNKNISKFVMKVSTKPLKEGDLLTLVGYGINTYRPYSSGAWTKRVGFNVYKKNNYLNRGVVQFEGLQKPVNENGTYNFASVGQGDSGGPLIANGKIVGIASAQALYNDVNSSYYAYTVSDKFYDFMFRAMQKI